MVLEETFYHCVSSSIPCNTLFYINNLKNCTKSAPQQELNTGHTHHSQDAYRLANHGTMIFQRLILYIIII